MKNIPIEYKVSPFVVFFLICTMQMGVGMLGFERISAKLVGNDAWISTLFFGLSVNVIIWIIYQILNRGNSDIITIQKNVFGKWIGGVFNLIFLVYLLMLGATTLHTYIEVVHVWMFPSMSTWFLSGVFLILCYYIVTGGFRVVAGIGFFGIVIPSILFFTFFYPLQYADFRNLFPMWQHSVQEIIKGMKGTMFSYLGFEMLLMYYPFIKNARTSQRYAHYGNLVTTVTYTYLMILSLTFFSEKQLSSAIWAYLSMTKIIQLPFIERFEYIIISVWAFFILPNISMTLWGVSRGIKETLRIKQKYVLPFLILFIFILTFFLNNRNQINVLNTWVGQAGFIYIYMYLPILWIIQTIQIKLRR
ncbi:GerAB/ArcD/ProY family transporter [Bacillus sp. SIMBA_074]|uniref:Spore germination protein (Amino acid permease) n=1 Tax=Bacillus cereus VD048 TaxID=1053226 RepID=J8HL52_BACCE|nr:MULTISPECIES: GerAB/ArcD/ProY family transporter [Bacillus cereus group]MBJ7997594.1 GerAB/ArcD/ProY family transporter [Bacillus cereus]EJQ39831.1 spore germination protein (amino acid permease) [Bacillus wiedmannii]EJQ40272.1 spore germination protein (amino acid permease) [Bacillus wiedmannii]EJR26635.1 spore germination protein (amino acid permease) [Bacillus cereus VD048]OAK29132.1 spore gernimation protein GerB [Bacillus wiedmannii]